MDTKTKLILASASPRRRMLLESAGFVLEVSIPEVDETPLPGEPPEPHALRLAQSKVEAVAARFGNERPILAADTIVVLDERILGKPGDPAEARAMLRDLSGREHNVITAVALRDPQGEVNAFAVATRVRFRELTSDEIKHYVASGEPLDKAGAYGIQGAAAHMVKSIEGSYTNVVGLPLAEVVEALR